MNTNRECFILKTAVYCRVSSDEQIERGTIENQIEFATKYCELHNIKITKWYKDNGITGILPLEERPEGSILLEDAKNKKIDLLLIYRLDRLGRSARIILNSVHELEQNGVKIKSMTEPFDTSDPSGRFLLTILAGVADLERETILERLRIGTNRAARAGKWLGGIVPYGYYVNPEGFLEINDTPIPGLEISEADVVRMIYTLIGKRGWSTIRVADYFNLIHIPPCYVIDNRKLKRGKRKVNTAGIWRPGRIRNMVVNTVYKGIHFYGKRSRKKRKLIERKVPAIVSVELWDKAQKTLADNRIEATRSAKRQYLLRGLIKCGTCGLTYCGTAFPGPKREPKGYYICNGKNAYRGPYQGKCPSKNIPQKWIETLVWNTCVSFIENPEGVMKELAKTIENTKPKTKTDIKKEKAIVQKSLQETETEKQRILDLYRKQLITMSDVETQLKKISTEKEALKQRVVELEEHIDTEFNKETYSSNIKELLAELREKIKKPLTYKTKRQIIKTLIKEIIVETTHDDSNKRRRPKAKVLVKYKFSQVAGHTGALADF